MTWDRKRIFKFVVATAFIGAFTLLFLPFYGEILLAAVVAFAMEPALGRWLQPRHLRWRTSVALILVGMFVVVATPVTVVAYKTYGTIVETSKAGFQNTELYGKITNLKTVMLRAANKVTRSFGVADEINLAEMSEDSLSKIANGVMGFLSGLVYQVPLFLLSVFIFCAALYFFLAEARVIKRIFARQQLLNPHESERLIEIFQRASYSTVVTSVVIAILQAVIVTIGALICDAGDFMIVFVVTFFCAFVPVIGAGPVAMALAAYKFLLGDYGQAIGLAVVSVVAGTSDNIARGFLISSAEEDLHPIVSLLAIIGALVIFGMPGLFLGPVIASVAVKIIPTLYSPPTVDAHEIAHREKV